MKGVEWTPFQYTNTLSALPLHHPGIIDNPLSGVKERPKNYIRVLKHYVYRKHHNDPGLRLCDGGALM